MVNDLFPSEEKACSFHLIRGGGVVVLQDLPSEYIIMLEEKLFLLLQDGATG